MKKALGFIIVLTMLAVLLCACEFGSPAPSVEPSTTEHVHKAEKRGNDETHHYDVCSCGEIMNRQEHTFSGEWVQVKGDGGCDDYSAYVKDCDGCYFQQYREEEPTGHNFVDFPMKEPTCSEDGYYPYTECTKCGLQSSSKEIWPATGNHIYNKEGYCTVCGAAAKGSAGLKLTLSDDGTYYIVTDASNCKDDRVTIPVEYQGKPVRVIGENAFSGNSTADHCIMYGNVLIIENNAFLGCSNLTTVQLGEKLEYIGEGAFSTLDGDPTRQVSTLPDSLEYIGDWAFMGCYFGSLKIPKNVSYIGKGAFECKTLFNVSCHPENKAYYSSENCLIERSTGTLITTGYGSFELPNDGSVKRIASCAFSNVGAETFDYYLPASVTYIEAYAFSHESWSITVHFAGTRAQWETVEKGDYISDNMQFFTVICADEE